MEIDQAFIAAYSNPLLRYSLNGYVSVFDRIREINCRNEVEGWVWKTPNLGLDSTLGKNLKYVFDKRLFVLLAYIYFWWRFSKRIYVCNDYRYRSRYIFVVFIGNTL